MAAADWHVEIQNINGDLWMNSIAHDLTAQLAAILDNAVDAIITIDARGIVLSVNPATTTLFGYRSEEVVGQNVKLLMPMPFKENHDRYIANYLQTGERKIIGVGREVVGRRKDGTEFPIHLAVSEIKREKESIFTGIVRDISDLKHSQLELSRANELLEQRIRERTGQLELAQSQLVEKERLATLGQVSGGIAHEIRNPLNAVKTSAYFLLNAKNITPEKAREHLERIDRQVDLIDNVVTALSDVAKLPEPIRQPLSVSAIAREALQTISVPDQVVIHVTIPEDTPHVLADQNQILIALRNLLRNAREAIVGNGRIEIVARRVDRGVSIAVEDTGMGIAPENLDRIMQPLFSTKARGMGLGLAISRTIVEKNFGTLEVVSSVGVGTTFTITLQSDS